jgi:hypothetical protein
MAIGVVVADEGLGGGRVVELGGVLFLRLNSGGVEDGISRELLFRLH